jgi:hypothetical protein
MCADPSSAWNRMYAAGGSAVGYTVTLLKRP